MSEAGGRESNVAGLIHKGRERLERQYRWFRALLQDPGDVGAICPSSPALAEEIASALSPSLLRSGTFVEVGAGTGPVTEALLRHGVPPARLVVIEKSEILADLLAEKFPETRVFCCGAEEMSRYLEPEERVCAVVSSLPFRSLPPEIARTIMTEIERTLAPGGFYVQFTYALIGEMPFVPASFRKLRSHFVLYNIPPAKVEVFRKPKSGVLVADGDEN